VYLLSAYGNCQQQTALVASPVPVLQTIPKRISVLSPEVYEANEAPGFVDLCRAWPPPSMRQVTAEGTFGDHFQLVTMDSFDVSVDHVSHNVGRNVREPTSRMGYFFFSTPNIRERDWRAFRSCGLRRSHENLAGNCRLLRS
jgi:hypothetical protein